MLDTASCRVERVLVIPAGRQMVLVVSTVTWKMVVEWEIGVSQSLLPLEQLESDCRSHMPRA